MKPFTMPSVATSLLLTSALTLSLSGCESTPSGDIGSRRASQNDSAPSTTANPTQLPATLDSLLKNTQLADPSVLFAAAMTAIKQNRLTDAGVLYQEAQIRRLTDLKRFPPNAEAQAALKNIERLKNTVSTALSPKLLDKPRIYAQIAQRLESRECASATGYVPAWTYTRVTPSVTCNALHQQKVRSMRDLSVLLSLPEYAEAAQLAEYYQNSSQSVRELAGLKDGYRQALATMRTIERKQKRVGLSSRF